jgi:hypothetical protein
MSCPDWRSLARLRSPIHEEDPAGWDDAVTHFENGCPSCRREALVAEPMLVFRRLREALEISAAHEVSEVDAARHAVAALRAAGRVGASRSRRVVRWRWVAAAGLTAAALSIPADNVWHLRQDRVALSSPAAALRGTVLPAAFSGVSGFSGVLPGDGELPTVEGVNRPGARIYHMDGEGLAVVMIVDESLDV